MVTHSALLIAAVVAATLTLASASGCAHLNSCNGHGTCDEANRICNCYDGYGSSSDTALYKAPDCSQRVCPADKAWVDIPTGATTAHNLAECSNAGICDRSTGRCRCFAGFEGDACQRSSCPSGCSGHGKCVSMSQMASEPNAEPIGPATTYGGFESTITWDENKIFGCVCDSTWTVGLASSETQATSWFGADCSLRRCPTGDDPATTSRDETDCAYYTANGGTWNGATNSDGTPNTVSPGSGVSGTLGVNFGATGNLCHVDCSNRGICDHSTGLCKCFKGYYGTNCGLRSALAQGSA